MKEKKIDCKIKSIKTVKSFRGEPQRCLISSNQDYVCLSTDKGSFIYKITPDADLKPFLKLDIPVNAFDAYKDRLICDKSVFSGIPSRQTQSFKEKCNVISALALSSDDLLLGLDKNG